MSLALLFYQFGFSHSYHSSFQLTLVPLNRCLTALYQMLSVASRLLGSSLPSMLPLEMLAHRGYREWGTKTHFTPSQNPQDRFLHKPHQRAVFKKPGTNRGLLQIVLHKIDIYKASQDDGRT